MKKLFVFIVLILSSKSYCLSDINFQDLKDSLQSPISSTKEEKIFPKESLDISNFQISATDYIYFGIYDERFNLIDFKTIETIASVKIPSMRTIKLKDFDLKVSGLVVVYVIVQRSINFGGERMSVIMPAKIYITNTLGSVDVYFKKHIGEKNK